MESKTYPGSYYQPLFDILHQEHGITPLESEMIDIIFVVEKMRGKQEGPRWVKASNYDISKGGMLFYRFDGPTMKSIGIGHFVCDMFHGVNLDVFPKWDWKYLYILDEQPAALKPYDHLYRLVFSNLAKLRARTQNNERMVDMADNIRSIIEDVTAKMMAMPQPDKTETPWQLYQSDDEQPAAGREEDAVEFAKWATSNHWRWIEGLQVWKNPMKDIDQMTTAELYQLFKQQKDK